MPLQLSRMACVAALAVLAGVAAAPAQAQTVNISSPGNGQTVSSPIRVSGSANSSRSVTLMQIYLDGKKVHEVKGSNVTADIPAASGGRRVTVQAMDSSGRFFNSSVNVTVSGSSTSSSSTSNGVTISSPGADQTVSSPFRVAASAPGAGLVQIYLDGSKVHEVRSSSVDTQVSASKGTRRLTVQALVSGNWVRNTINVNVGSTSASTSGSTSNGVTISSPSSGQTVSSPFRVAGSASGASLMQIYLDGKKVNERSGSSIDVQVSASTGTRRLTLQAYVSGSWRKNTIDVNVGSSSSSSSPPPSDSKRTYWNIDEMSGWEHCTVCAGRDGNGPVAKYSMTLNQSSPSMDGKSAKFSLLSGSPYANALWWKQLGGNDSASNFIYELYFYIDKPSVSQALEFDLNQTRAADKRRYIWGTECDYKHRKVWKVWDTANGTWITTSIPCPVPQAFKWHRLVFEFQRSNGNTRFISITINGQKHYVNRTYGSRSANWSTLNVAFQMDGDSGLTPYNVWLDKVHLTAW